MIRQNARGAIEYAFKMVLTNHCQNIEKCAGTQRLRKLPIFGRAINMQSRRPTEQCFYIWKPLHGCLHKVKKVHRYPLIRKDQQSNKYAF